MKNEIKRGADGRMLPSDEVVEQFESLWKIYPKKKGKEGALRSFNRNVKKYGYEQIKRSLERYIKEKAGVDSKYLLMGNNFFRDRFVDYLDENYNESQIETMPIVEVKTIEKIKVVAKVEGYEDYLIKMRYMPYEDYLQTEHWLHFREETLKFFGKRCMVCNTEESIPYVHHRTYENRGRETFNDVIVLCEHCHALFHDKVCKD